MAASEGSQSAASFRMPTAASIMLSQTKIAGTSVQGRSTPSMPPIAQEPGG